MRSDFPFAAVVGQDDLKLALLLVAVDPTIGGVLVTGERGTAKSTAARGLAALLPKTPAGTAAPFIELPLGATEDRVVGSLDISKVLKEGSTQLRPGVLARAHGGVLYVDEVNLLPDPLVDLLLDAAASGWVTVERDGISAVEAARFVLIGTMNPEEGELRPQFLDRFGLCVAVRGLMAQEIRVAAIRQRLAFDDDAAAVLDAAEPAEQALRDGILAARERLATLRIGDAHLSAAAALSIEQGLDGIRGDLALIKAARALAAWQAAPAIDETHIRRAAELALAHRTRQRPSRSRPSSARAGSSMPRDNFFAPRDGADEPSADRIAPRVAPTVPQVGRSDASGGEAARGARQTERQSQPRAAETAPQDSRAAARAPMAADAEGASREALSPPAKSLPHRSAAPADSAPVQLLTDLIDRSRAGRRGTAPAGQRARGVDSFENTGTLAIHQTLLAAARQGARVAERGVTLAAADLRQHRRGGQGRGHVLFLVDASGSMATQRRLAVAKDAALGLLAASDRRRDEVALMTFRGEGTDLVLPFTRQLAGIEQALSEVPTGGRTPLARALLDAAQVLQTRTPSLLVLLTDGRANVGVEGGDPWDEALSAGSRVGAACAGALVIDCEPGPIVLGRARLLAQALDAQCVALDSIDTAGLTLRIQRRIDSL